MSNQSTGKNLLGGLVLLCIFGFGGYSKYSSEQRVKTYESWASKMRQQLKAQSAIFEEFGKAPPDEQISKLDEWIKRSKGCETALAAARPKDAEILEIHTLMEKRANLITKGLEDLKGGDVETFQKKFNEVDAVFKVIEAKEKAYGKKHNIKFRN